MRLVSTDSIPPPAPAPFCKLTRSIARCCWWLCEAGGPAAISAPPMPAAAPPACGGEFERNEGWRSQALLGEIRRCGRDRGVCVCVHARARRGREVRGRELKDLLHYLKAAVVTLHAGQVRSSTALHRGCLRRGVGGRGGEGWQCWEERGGSGGKRRMGGGEGGRKVWRGGLNLCRNKVLLLASWIAFHSSHDGGGFGQ